MPVVSKMPRAPVRTDESGVLSHHFEMAGDRLLLNWNWSLLVLWLVIGGGGLARANEPSSRLTALMQKHQETFEHFAADLEAVAGTCQANQMADLAAEIRQIAQPLESQPGNIDQLPAQVQPDLPANLPEAEKAARVRVRKLRNDYSKALYALSLKAQRDHHASLAYRLVREVLLHDPDHAEARRLFGYRRAGNEWTTPFAIDMKNKGKVWHDEFGWIESKYLARYLEGERFYKGKWMPAAKEAALRANFPNGWDINTEHFEIKTNYSQKKGAQLAAKVEVFHRYFMREFVAFYQTPQQLETLFTSGTSARRENRYRVHHYRLQQEFVQCLAPKCPVAGQIKGIYMPGDRTAYFFQNPKITEAESLETLYHEVTHQLLSESTSQTDPVGHVHDFWAIEGIACYHESFHVADDGTISVGDLNHPRIKAARDQVVVTQDQEPLARFTAAGMLQFQKGDLPTLQKRYAQATGLAHFLMNGKDGLYRDGFIEYLAQIYSPDQRVRVKNAKTLEQILGVPYATLDKEYAAHFQAMSPKK